MTALGRRVTPGLDRIGGSLPDTRWLVQGTAFALDSPLSGEACQIALERQVRPVPDLTEWLHHLNGSHRHRGSSVRFDPPEALYGWATYEVKARIGPWPHPFSPWVTATLLVDGPSTHVEGALKLPRWTSYTAIAVSGVWMLYFWRGAAAADGIDAFVSGALTALFGFGVLAVLLVVAYWHARIRFFADQRRLLQSLTDTLSATVVMRDTGPA